MDSYIAVAGRPSRTSGKSPGCAQSLSETGMLHLHAERVTQVAAVVETVVSGGSVVRSGREAYRAL